MWPRGTSFRVHRIRASPSVSAWVRRIKQKSKQIVLLCGLERVVAHTCLSYRAVFVRAAAHEDGRLLLHRTDQPKKTRDLPYRNPYPRRNPGTNPRPLPLFSFCLATCSHISVRLGGQCASWDAYEQAGRQRHVSVGGLDNETPERHLWLLENRWPGKREGDGTGADQGKPQVQP